MFTKRRDKPGRVRRGNPGVDRLNLKKSFFVKSLSYLLVFRKGDRQTFKTAISFFNLVPEITILDTGNGRSKHQTICMYND